MKTLAERICENLRAELQMATMKRGELVRANLATDKIDARIDSLRARLREVEAGRVE